MFVRTKRVEGKEYRQLVENYRENGRHRQHVLVHLGQQATLEGAIAETHQKLEDLEESRLARDMRGAVYQARELDLAIRGRHAVQLERHHDGRLPAASEVREHAPREQLYGSRRDHGALVRLENDLRNYWYWRECAVKKHQEYETRKQRLSERLEKLEVIRRRGD